MFFPRHWSKKRSIDARNNAWSLKIGVISLKTIPFFGKSETSRTPARNLSTESAIIPRQLSASGYILTDADLGLYTKKVTRPSRIVCKMPTKNHLAAMDPGIGTTTYIMIAQVPEKRPIEKAIPNGATEPRGLGPPSPK